MQLSHCCTSHQSGWRIWVGCHFRHPPRGYFKVFRGTIPNEELGERKAASQTRLFLCLYCTLHSYTTSATMTWQPQQQGLEEVLLLLRQSSSSDSEIQRAVTQVCRLQPGHDP
jgi:hypothetical protein